MLSFVVAMLLQAATAASANASAEIVVREEEIAKAASTIDASNSAGLVDLANIKMATGESPGSITEAVQMLERAAETGEPCALLQASRAQRDLLGDEEEAIKDLERALTLGCPDARYELAARLVRDNRDMARAVSLLREAVNYGDTRAMNLLGRLYQAGAGGGGADQDQAVTSFRQAAIEGDQAGQSELVQSLRARDQARPSQALFREALYWALIAARTGGPAAEALAREILEEAPARLTQADIENVRNAAARYRPGSFTFDG